MLHVKNLSVNLGGRQILDNVSFHLAEGERISVVGTGGCGKTTLLKVVLGLVPPSHGSVILLGRDVTRLSAADHSVLMREVGVAFQRGGLFDSMTVGENLEYALASLSSEPAATFPQAVTRLLEGVKLGGAAQLFPHELSGGMQRRVGIARALCNQPRFALFDEPTSGLDPVTSTIILNMIRDLGMEVPSSSAIVLSSNTEIGVRYARRNVVMDQGRVVADADWLDLMGSDAPPWVQHFMSARFRGLAPAYLDQLGIPPHLQAQWQSS